MRRGAARCAFAVLPLLFLLVQASASGSLGSRVAPPPTPVPPRGSPSPFLSRLTTPAHPGPVPEVEGSTVLLADLGTGQILVQKGAREVRPIASLTKIMTALLVLEDEKGRLDRVVSVHPDAVFSRGDYGGGSTLGLRAGERISVRGLVAGLLVGSANDAAEALAVVESGSVASFVQQMNARARALEMRDTRFASPHGLDDRGHSSAADLLILVRAALRIPTFRDLIGRRFVTIPSAPGPARRIQNRNVMLWLYPGAFGVKTGYTTGAGFCLVATARRGGRDLGVIVLGGRHEVFSDAASLLNHGFAAYERRTLVEEGEPLGTVALRGGRVPVVAGNDLAVLVRASEQGLVRRVVSTSSSVGYPPPGGTVVGSVRVSVSGTTLGRVPLLVGVLAPPAAPPGPWWGRAAGAVARAVTTAVGGLFGSVTEHPGPEPTCC